MNGKAMLIALGACLFAAGCSPLAPRPDQSKFFILTPLSDGSGPAETPASSNADSPLTIGVGPIDFPDYLRRLEVVTRESPESTRSLGGQEMGRAARQKLCASFL